jgi:hypothetical protein
MKRNYDTKVADYVQEYRDQIIWKATTNSSGIRYYAYTAQGIQRADTLKGIKKLLSKTTPYESVE